MAVEIDSLFRCEICAAPFVPLSRHHTHTCGRVQCRNRRDYLTKRARPERVEWERAKCRAYRAEHPNGVESRASNVVLRAAPAYATHLPGAACAIKLAPHVTVDLAQSHWLHGALTSILGTSHDPNRPEWSLLPWERGWAVYWWSDARAALAGTAHAVRLGCTRTTLTFGAAAKMRAPIVAQRGWHTVRLDALTPVAIRTMAGAVTQTRPTAGILAGTLSMLAARLGVKLTREELAIELVSAESAPAIQRHAHKLGGDGRIRGWTGSVAVHCNAPARWLLECAARGPGLGGRVAYGFGRVRVSEVTE